MRVAGWSSHAVMRQFLRAARPRVEQVRIGLTFAIPTLTIHVASREARLGLAEGKPYNRGAAVLSSLS